MKLVMTLMVRDEVDIVAAMIEHHLAQGVDLIIATDNGSVDGTREVLAAYAATGMLELHDYLEHDKKQFAVVTDMARRAFTVHGADWVINADADEFFVPVDRTLTLHDVFEQLPKSLGSFIAPVVNMTGYPAKDGSGLHRLRWRDERPEESLADTAGLHAQPTADAVHVGTPDVEVSQGNHRVSIPSTGQPEPSLAIEVLHYPWRSWRQFSTKVEKSGIAYTNNPNLFPSPRHHGMRDYRFLRAGVLEHFYVYRHPDLSAGGARVDGIVQDDWLSSELDQLVASGCAVNASMLEAVLADDGSAADYPPAARSAAAEVVGYIVPLDAERAEALDRAHRERNVARAEAMQARRQLAQERDRSERGLLETLSTAVYRRTKPLRRGLRRVLRRPLA